jgi:hypothetical protein
MIGLLIGAALGGLAVWHWRDQIEHYVGDFGRLREKAVDAAKQGTAQLKDALQSAADRPPSAGPGADRRGGR